MNKIQSIRAQISTSSHPDTIIQEVFELQKNGSEVYRQWTDEMRGAIKRIKGSHPYPFLPIQFFKQYGIQSFSFIPETTFMSSGTTGQTRSRHLIDDLRYYQKRCEECFAFAYAGVEQYRHIFFLPFYQSNPHSSLLYMAQHFIDVSMHKGSRFVSSPEEVSAVIDNDKIPTVLWSVTYGVLDLLDARLTFQHPDLKFLETGGSKGVRAVPNKRDLHDLMRGMGDGVQPGSEFGMCELMSQCYFKRGRFWCPPGFYSFCTEVDDPLYILELGKRGRLCFIDLANVHSCAFIETEDLGITHADGSFEVLGRLEASDLRGCNLMYQ